jgi:hypothetical protein
MKLKTIILATAFALTSTFALAQSGLSGSGSGVAPSVAPPVGSSTTGAAIGPGRNASGNTLAPNGSPSGSTLAPTGPGSGLRSAGGARGRR